MRVRKDNPIARVVKAINDDFGAGTVEQIKSSTASIPITGVYTTGFETIDMAWGRGGVPWGRTAILHGREGGGKTTIALTTAAAAQRDNALVVYIDAEFKLDLNWAAKCGLNLKDVVLLQPEYLEKAVAVVDAVMRKAQEEKIRSFVVLDSMNSCGTKAEHEGDWEDDHYYGPKARVYSKVLPRLVKSIKLTDSVLMLVSQTRSGPQGNHIACGNAPKFYSSSIARFSVPKNHRVKQGDQVVAVDLEVEFVKNQVSQPYRKARFRIAPDGPDFGQSLIEAAVSRGLVSKGGAGWMEWSRDEGPIKFQGPSGWCKLVEKQPELETQLRAAVREPYWVSHDW